ncbi:RagB/SusD family nutrient uptake outer membrane protein [Sunxiuqinia rutila]|uniref:RagB/SusD family nutrient uptake outer membrane protein n=1 Tax=Sunxiuqinia rutila TaxID=1397841 RepID=UPI003D366D62
MKSTLKYSLIFVLAALIGCQELEREDFNQIYPENFFQNEDDVKNASTAMYRLFHIYSYGGGGLYSHGRFGVNIFTEVSTDIMACRWGDGGTWAAFNEHTWTAENTKGVSDSYYRYNWLSKGEQIIKNIKESPVTDDIKNRYIAQIEGLQGWLAYVLFDLYGGIPIADPEVLENFEEEIYLPRKTNAEMVSYIEGKLNSAAQYLPVSYPSSDWGRITKGAAKTLLLKLYMHEKDWAKAEEVAREIMKPEYGYELLSDYKAVFAVETEINNETILAIPCNVSDFANGWAAHALLPDYPYAIAGAAKWGGYQMEWDFYNTYEANDKRLETIIGEYEAGGVVYNQENHGDRLNLGAIPLKYGVDPSHIGDKAGNDVPVFRYADIILSLAEAINNINNGPTAEAYSLINMVRNRAGLDNLQAGLSKDAFNDALLLERGHEFYCEGHRRTDLIRHGKYVEYAKLKPNNGAAEHKVLYPIPNSAITESKGAVVQNPGY